jgi:hypothetical protein
MKVVLRSSSVLLSLLGMTAKAPLSRARSILRRGSTDSVRIGMSVIDLLAEFGSQVEIDEAAGRANIFLASAKQRRPDLMLEIRDGVVTSIRIYSSRYKTESGVGPGDGIITLGSQYQMHWKDDNTAVVRELNMEFQVEKDRVVSVLIL